MESQANKTEITVTYKTTAKKADKPYSAYTLRTYNNKKKSQRFHGIDLL